MTELFTPGFWIAAGEIVVVNLVLSGDNAIVIALACRNLPQHQRRLAVFWGVFGAVAARLVLTGFAVSLLTLPWLKLVGGALLLWIGAQLIGSPPGEGDAEVSAHERLLNAISTIVMADVIMSLDNVVGVAAAANGSLVLLVFGLALSIPIVVLGSDLVMRLLARWPLLVIAGGGLLGYIAGQMAVTDPVALPFSASHATLALETPYLCIAVVVMAGLALRRWRA